MKKFALLLSALCVALGMQAQVAKTVNLATAGTLGTVLTENELATITDLNLSGSIDARDFVTIRDKMKVLATIDMSTAKVVAYTGTEGTAGTTSKTYPADVFSLCNPATYWGKSSLISVTLPSSLTAIGSGAFAICTGLTTINIPSSVTSIGDYAFADCFSLTSISIPSSVTSIGDFAFLECRRLTAISIPNSVASIGRSAFSTCSGLTAISIPNSVTSIGSSAFSECSGLTAISIPPSVTSIGDYAFNKCSGLSSLSVDAANTAYTSADDVLYNKDKTVLIYCIATKKGSFSIPSSVVSIEERAFALCTGLSAISIPNSVESIGCCAFQSCTGLSSISIPRSVEYIEREAFLGCSGLSSIKVFNPAPVALSSASVFEDVPNTIPLYVPAGSKAAYSAAEVWKDFGTITELSCVASAAAILAKEANSAQTLDVAANTSWAVSTAADWLSVLPAAEVDGNGAITITAKSANTGGARTATLTLSAAGVPAQTITITQAAGTASALPETPAPSIALYPNPTASVFKLSANALVTVYSETGALIFAKQAAAGEAIPVGALSAGTYTVVVKTAASLSTQRLVKE